MKVLFAINNEQVIKQIIDKYTELYGEKLEYKCVHYFKALIGEIKIDKSYDRIIVAEDLEPFVNSNMEAIDQYLFNKIDSISDELINTEIIFICQERRTKDDKLLKRFFSLGIYNMLIGRDRNIDTIANIINSPRNKKDAKSYINYGIEEVYERENSVDEVELNKIMLYFKKLGESTDKYEEAYNSLSEQYNIAQMQIINKYLPIGVRKYLETNSEKYKMYSNANKVQQPTRPQTQEQQQHQYQETNVEPKQEKIDEELKVPEPKKSKTSFIKGKLSGLKEKYKKNIDKPNKEVKEKVQEKVEVKEEVQKEIKDDIVKEEGKEEVKKEVVQIEELINENKNAEMVFGMPKDYSKAVLFVGGSKAGTSFLVNAIGYILSKSGIKTAILDMTRERSMYYIYTNNIEKLRRKAEDSIFEVIKREDIPSGIEVNKNLSVYTSMPGTDRRSYNHLKLIEKLKMKYNIVLIDTDFTTPIDYYRLAKDIYVVQDMDILKIQEMTAFLRELKLKDITLSKIQIIINKYIKSKVTGKKIMEGLAYYYDPQMTFVDELLDPRMNYYTVPFDSENYAKYVDNLYSCNMDFGNFTDDFMKMLSIICNVIYPIGNNVVGKKYLKKRSFFNRG